MESELEQTAAANLGEPLLDISADAILATHRQGVIRFWNPGAVRIFSFTQEESIGGSLDKIIPNGSTNGTRMVMRASSRLARRTTVPAICSPFPP